MQSISIHRLKRSTTRDGDDDDKDDVDRQVDDDDVATMLMVAPARFP